MCPTQPNIPNRDKSVRVHKSYVFGIHALTGFATFFAVLRVGPKWAAMPTEEKAALHAESQRLLEEYRAKLDIYKQSGLPAQFGWQLSVYSRHCSIIYIFSQHKYMFICIHMLIYNTCT